jgi:hypothetical protein
MFRAENALPLADVEAHPDEALRRVYPLETLRVALNSSTERDGIEDY